MFSTTFILAKFQVPICNFEFQLVKVRSKLVKTITVLRCSLLGLPRPTAVDSTRRPASILALRADVQTRPYPFHRSRVRFSSPSPSSRAWVESSSNRAIAGRRADHPHRRASILRAPSCTTSPSTFLDHHLSSSPAELAETLTLPSAAIGANPSSTSLASIRFSDHPPLKSTPRTGSW